jgi:hypothetical protein
MVLDQSVRDTAVRQRSNETHLRKLDWTEGLISRPRWSLNLNPIDFSSEDSIYAVHYRTMDARVNKLGCRESGWYKLLVARSREYNADQCYLHWNGKKQRVTPAVSTGQPCFQNNVTSCSSWRTRVRQTWSSTDVGCKYFYFTFNKKPKCGEFLREIFFASMWIYYMP